MEKVLEVEALQAQHFTTVFSLVQHNIKLSGSINQFAQHAKTANQHTMSKFIDDLREKQKGEVDNES